MHVKEPQPQEYGLIREGQIALHLPSSGRREELTQALIAAEARSISPTKPSRKRTGTLPLLTPMSEVAGRMAVQEGRQIPGTARAAAGILLGGVPGVEPATVLVIGGGVVGTNAAHIACGLGAKVYLLDIISTASAT